mmetsp:Transcript_5906/g.9418  ORF Transcript_5906/g.9418 Transcript_5906/m.9418 type:complete len:253 (+) Transcript_5906:166-924(+)
MVSRPNALQQLCLTPREEGVEESHQASDEVGLQLAHRHQSGEETFRDILVGTEVRGSPNVNTSKHQAEHDPSQVLCCRWIQCAAGRHMKDALQRRSLEDLGHFVDFIQRGAVTLQPLLNQFTARCLVRARQPQERSDVRELHDSIQHLPRVLLGERHEELCEGHDTCRTGLRITELAHHLVQDAQQVHVDIVASSGHLHQHARTAFRQIVIWPANDALEALEATGLEEGSSGKLGLIAILHHFHQVPRGGDS